MTYSPKVHVIPAKTPKREKRVGIYCRVSTNDAEQLNSLAVQVSAHTRLTAPQVQLFNAEGEEEKVDIYTKFNVIDMSNRSRTVVISFHKLNKPIDYLFR